MENPMFSSFNFSEIQGGYDPLQGYQKEEIPTEDQLFSSFGLTDYGRFDSLSSPYDLYDQHNLTEKRVHLFNDQQQTISDSGWIQNDFLHTGMPFSVQATNHDQRFEAQIPDLGEPMNEKPYPFSLSSFEILSYYEGEYKNSREGNLSNQSDEKGASVRKLSTEEIMRVAGERFIQFSTQRINGFTMSIHPYGSSLSGLSIQETRDIGLVHNLLSAAEKIGYKQFDNAARLLSHCEFSASDSGNPVQRIVYCFSEALRERINVETGRIPTEKVNEKIRHGKGLVLGSNLAFVACHLNLPVNQVMLFAGMQAILENIATAKKIHLIDLQIRSGVQWAVLMQALAEVRLQSPIQLLKITAIGTTEKQKIEDTGKRLLSFAESLNLPFSFKVVFLSNMKDLKEELFDIEAGETVAVYSPAILRTMISSSDCLENLMKIVRKLKPSTMVVMEIEANHNSPSFVNRFIEALFYYSAFFDCLEDCMDRDNQYRMAIEGIHFRDGIRNIIAAEGEERFTRNVKISVWRAFFKRFGMVETELSESSLYQANLVLKNKHYPCGSSCTLDINGKCLLVGWKGTPLLSLSTWKFL